MNHNIQELICDYASNMIIEIVAYNINQVQSQIQFGNSLGIRNFNFVNKSKTLNIDELFENLNNFDTCNQFNFTFSLQHNYYNGDEIQIATKIQEIILKNNALTSTQKSKANLLVVTGSRKQRLSTLDCLELINKIDPKTIKDINVAVAYNPNINPSLLQIENLNLVQKLHYQFVKIVYIQITTNLKLIETGINFVKSLKPGIEVIICIVIPSKTFLNNFKFRPWSGVNFEPGYLDSLTEAENQTLDIIQFCIQQKIKIVLTLN